MHPASDAVRDESSRVESSRVEPSSAAQTDHTELLITASAINC